MEENILDEMELPLVEVPNIEQQKKPKTRKKEVFSDEQKAPVINCLRNERITVRHIDRQRGMVTNPKHVLYGGMAENAVKTYVVPRLSSGMYVNVLTDSEKSYLEDIMGLENNALSIYKKQDNFWDDSNENGISRVRLTKQDNYFNLSDPEDYIRYKILLANKDFIAPSMQVLEDRPKSTYEFVIISEGEEVKSKKANMSATMQCYKEFGKIESDLHKLRTIVEIIDGRPTAPNTQLEFLQTKINNIIQSNNKLFLKVVTDPLLDTKVLIKRAVEAGIISRRNDFYYLRKDNMPLCNNGEDSTLSNAARFLNLPKNQEMKFSIEAQLSN